MHLVLAGVTCCVKSDAGSISSWQLHRSVGREYCWSTRLRETTANGEKVPGGRGADCAGGCWRPYAGRITSRFQLACLLQCDILPGAPSSGSPVAKGQKHLRFAGRLRRSDCSMRACDNAPSPVVGTSPFVLLTPLIMRSPASAEPARVQALRFFPFNISIPLTPPPRTLPS